MNVILKRHPLRLLALLVCLPAATAQAVSPALGESDTSVIEAHDFSNASGVISVNEAAGAANQQVNARAIAVHPNGAAVAGNNILQITHNEGLGAGVGQAVTRIGEQA